MPHPQTPIPSVFGHGSTAAEVIKGIDLSGKIALVTGGYSGIGTETTKALVSAGAKVIVAGRRPEEADITLADIRDQIDVVKLELSDPASIDACAAAVAEKTGKIDLLINNAGIMACPLARDARGYESQFATNHLGHFQLAMRLWPLVKATGAGARVIALSSLAHKRSAFHPEDPNYERRDYEKWQAYGQAKTANALFALYLDTLASPSGIRAFSVHPGGIMTNLGRYLTEEDIAMMRARSEGDASAGPSFEWKTVEQGAATTVWAATSPLLADKGGVYCEDCDIAALTGPDGLTQPGGVMPHACDADAAAKLWEISEDLTGIRWPG
ncbi:MAG: oxidoreductase [Sphingorhabdus sp.]|nr:SDR family NAD(P)-dependent oxidoreductase [Sphingomonadales bacterium]MBL0022518.1 SDR family NAD(P)-dependent oxidoreductase [Sphingomonadales bacterium]